MAWRIHDNVIRGEIDNREKGKVRGRIWLQGVAEPVVLELKGNAHPDLAGCLLKFENRGKTIPMRADAQLNPQQRGTIGDLTASRKVRVFDIPFEEAYALLKRGEKPPEHMANSLYLEWFSQANGRVVIESADYHLDISEPAWRLTPEENEQRGKEAAAGFAGFMNQLGEALEATRHEPPEDKDWDEFDYEKLLRESDARTDKYAELLDKYKDEPDRDRIIAREMGWTRMEEALAESEARESTEEAPAQDDSEDDKSFSFEVPEDAEMDPDPLTQGVDWIRTKDGDIKHPLSSRALEGVLELMTKLRKLGLEECEDADLTSFVDEFQITGAKLAGALDTLAFGRDLQEGAFIVAYLKRALDHLHKAQAGLEAVAPKQVLPEDVTAWSRRELFEIREGILRLMDEFRGRKKQGNE